MAATGAVDSITSGYPAPGLRNTSRFITSHNDEGKGYFHTSDHGSHHRVMGEKQAVMNIMYSTSSTPVDLNNESDIKFAQENEPGLVIPQGSVLRMMDFGPGLESIPHRAVTCDYGVVLEGEFRLTLDSGESRILRRGDTLIQRATSHKWENISGGGKEAGRILFLLLGVEEVRVNGDVLDGDLGALKREYER